jgi:hypothetical protein
MKILGASRARRVLLGVAASVSATLLLLGSSQAATPSSGTVSQANPTVSWSGPSFAAPTASANCGGPDNPSCDNFKLTIVPPASSFAVEIKLQPFAAGDWDLQVYDPAGNLVGSSGNAPSQLEQVTLTNPAAGTYTVSAAPFAPNPGLASYTASATLSLQQAPPPPPPPGTENVTYATYPAPDPLGKSAGEPSIGANHKSGRTMYQAGLEALRVTWDDCSSPANADWKDVTFPTEGLVSLDPIGFCDAKTGRYVDSQLSAKCSTMAFTDDDGANWTPSQGCGINSGVDHQTVGGGPFHAPLTGTVYPNAVYYCSQDAALAQCARSDNGGLTFGVAIPVWTLADCGGLHGHVKVAPNDGTVYVPNKNCNGKQAVAVSEDNGLTWTVQRVSQSTNGAWDPSVGIGSDGTVYFGFDDSSDLAKVSVSHDRGRTWSQPVDVGAPLGVKHAAFPAVVAGDPNRAAFAFLGTTEASGGAFGDNPNWPGVWHLYVAHTYDGGSSWTTVDVTPNDPVQRGTICAGGFNGCPSGTRNLLDFMDATVDKFGRVLVGYADGCLAACVTGPPNSFSELATIARQVNGKRLFAQSDVLGVPDAPGGVNVKASAGPPAANIVTWQAPDDHGSPITGYRIYRRTAPSTSFSLLASVGASARSYSDTAIVAGQTYFYKISAVNAVGEGPTCREFTPQAAGTPESPCTEPGITVLTDASGDALDGQPAHDVGKLSIAEPASLGDGKIEFVLKMASLSSVPPNTTWPVQFKTPDGTDRWVRMSTNAASTVSFAFGTGTNVSPLTNAGTPADPASTFSTDGTIKIVVARSAIGNPLVGQNITQFLTRIRVEGGAVALTPDNMPDSLARAGSYTVFGSENCKQPDLTLSPSDIAFSSTKITGGDVVTITAAIHNFGNANATNVGVRFADNGTQLGSNQTIASIAPGGTGTASAVWDTKHLTGQHTIQVTADPANTISESSEVNNSAARTVTVQGNKVKNPSFESSSTGSSPDNWSSSGSTTYAQGGSDGLRSVTTGPGGSWVSDAIDVQAGASYGFSAAVSGAAATVVVQQLSATGAVLGSVQVPFLDGPAGLFGTVTGSLTAASGVAQVRVKLTGPLAGTTAFDDIRLWQQ